MMLTFVLFQGVTSMIPWRRLSTLFWNSVRAGINVNTLDDKQGDPATVSNSTRNCRDSIAHVRKGLASGFNLRFFAILVWQRVFFSLAHTVTDGRIADAGGIRCVYHEDQADSGGAVFTHHWSVHRSAADHVRLLRTSAGARVGRPPSIGARRLHLVHSIRD